MAATLALVALQPGVLRPKAHPPHWLCCLRHVPHTGRSRRWKRHSAASLSCAYLTARPAIPVPRAGLCCTRTLSSGCVTNGRTCARLAQAPTRCSFACRRAQGRRQDHVRRCVRSRQRHRAVPRKGVPGCGLSPIWNITVRRECTSCGRLVVKALVGVACAACAENSPRAASSLTAAPA